MPEIDLLDPEKIKANLDTKRIAARLLVYDTTPSTNDLAAEYAKDKQNDGLTIFAEHQTKGRGRAGTQWLSAPAQSILCSVVLIESKINAELLSLTCAVAVAEAVAKNAKIKWPNDILLNGKKVAGILLESKSYDTHTAYILGIGINCHQKKSDFPKDLQNTATSIDLESGSTTDRISLAKRLLTSLDHHLQTAETNSSKIIEKWSSLSVQLHHRVNLIFNSRKFTGNCIGIDPEKGLILQLDSGGIRMFDAAHTTIAK